MRFRSIAVLLCLACSSLFAGSNISANQLVDMVRSSLALKYEDGKIAKYVKGVKLTDKLDRKTVEDLEAQGAGPKTVKALQELCSETSDMKSTGAQTGSPGTSTNGSGLTSSMPSSFPQPPPPNSVDQKKILELIRQYADNYTQNLPNFLCVQATSRYVSFDGGENYRFEDRILTKLSYSNGQENYKVYQVNNKMVDIDMEKLGGAISSGEFGTLMKSLFAPKSSADFNWDHWARLRGQVKAVFNYFIDSGHSDYMLDYGRGEQRIVTAYRGLIYADQYTGAIARITFDAVDVPATFPIRQAGTILDYDDAKIGDNTYILPLRAYVKMAGPNNVHTKNDEQFRLYQKFGTESNITFSPDALPDAKTAEQQPTEDPLMKGLPPPPPK